MTDQKLIEILEDDSYDIELMPKTGSILAGKTGCAAIVAVESSKTVSGWVFQVGKNTVGNIDDAIKFSKNGVIS